MAMGTYWVLLAVLEWADAKNSRQRRSTAFDSSLDFQLRHARPAENPEPKSLRRVQSGKSRQNQDWILPSL